MRNILFIIAVLLIIAWVLGLFVYGIVGLINILVVLGIISMLFGVMRKA